MTTEKKLLCPQCKIASLYVKDELGERILVYVDRNGTIIFKNPETKFNALDMSEVYCLGCSWHGSPKRLVKY